MARASQVGQAVLAFARSYSSSGALIRRGWAGEHRLPHLWAHCKFHDIRSFEEPLACARGSESAATIPRDLLPSRAQRVLRQEALLLRRMAVSRQKPAIGSFEAPPALSVLCPSQRFRVSAVNLAAPELPRSIKADGSRRWSSVVNAAYSKRIPCASGNCVDQLTVFVCLRM
jgi:hypothetical protein